MYVSYYLLIIAVIVEALVIHHMKIKQEAQRFMQAALYADQAELQGRLVEKVRMKIEMTQRSKAFRINKDDLMANYIYKQDRIQELGQELQEIFGREFAALKSKYPQLTELDKLVIALLGLEMDNDEICEIMHMEKRTLYRRRQLIAQRIGLSSTLLESFAKATCDPDSVSNPD